MIVERRTTGESSHPHRGPQRILIHHHHPVMILLPPNESQSFPDSIVERSRRGELQLFLIDSFHCNLMHDHHHSVKMRQSASLSPDPECFHQVSSKRLRDFYRSGRGPKNTEHGMQSILNRPQHSHTPSYPPPGCFSCLALHSCAHLC